MRANFFTKVNPVVNEQKEIVLLQKHEQVEEFKLCNSICSLDLNNPDETDFFRLWTQKTLNPGALNICMFSN